MSLAALLLELWRRRVTVLVVTEAEPRRLRYRAPHGALDDGIREAAKVYRSALLKLFVAPSMTPAIAFVEVSLVACYRRLSAARLGPCALAEDAELQRRATDLWERIEHAENELDITARAVIAGEMAAVDSFTRAVNTFELTWAEAGVWLDRQREHEVNVSTLEHDGGRARHEADRKARGIAGGAADSDAS